MTFRSCLAADSCVVGSSTSATGTTNALVSFDLIENRKYSASMTVLYNGGVEQQSQSVEISECCLHSVKNDKRKQFDIKKISKYLNTWSEKIYQVLILQAPLIYVMLR